MDSYHRCLELHVTPTHLQWPNIFIQLANVWKGSLWMSYLIVDNTFFASHVRNALYKCKQFPATYRVHPFESSFWVFGNKAHLIKAWQCRRTFGLEGMGTNLKFSMVVFISGCECAWRCVPPIPNLQVAIILCESLWNYQCGEHSERTKNNCNYKWFVKYGMWDWEPLMRHLHDKQRICNRTLVCLPIRNTQRLKWGLVDTYDKHATKWVWFIRLLISSEHLYLIALWMGVDMRSANHKTSVEKKLDHVFKNFVNRFGINNQHKWEDLYACFILIHSHNECTKSRSHKHLIRFCQCIWFGGIRSFSSTYTLNTIQAAS